MISYSGEDFPTHEELFKKYPWLRQKNRKINRRTYLNAKKNKPCADCGLYWHPLVMTLDHPLRNGYKTNGGKRRHPANLLSYLPEEFEAELAKCEVVCMNCHAIREWIRDKRYKNKHWQDFSDLHLKGALVEGQSKLHE